MSTRMPPKRWGRSDASAVPALIQALKDSEWFVRRYAAEALGQIGDASAVPALIQALKDSNEYVRRYAAEALGQIGDASAVAALIQALKDSEEYVRRYAALALGQIGLPAVPALIQALKDSNEYVRWYAAKALGKIGLPAVPALIQALKDSEEDVRADAAEALGKIGDARALPRKALADPRLSPPEKIALLEAMRNVRYSEAGVTLRYRVPDLYAFCQTVVNEGDEEERAGAQAVLDYLNHLRPAERDPSR
jgi:HEAT repeat protein